MTNIRPKPKTAAELGIGDVRQVIDEVYILDYEIRSGEAHFICPSHDDKKPSAHVNLVTGYWNCWSCQGGGDIISLGCAILKKKRLAVEAALIPREPDAIRAAIVRTVEARRAVQTPDKDTQTKDRVADPDEYDVRPMDYMYNRGFTQDTLDKYGVRYVHRTSVKTRSNKDMTIYHSVAVPIYDESGAKLLSWCYRSTPDSAEHQPRYFYLAGTSTADLLFGHHLTHDSHTVVVTEGPLDSMFVSQAGHPAVALFGASNNRSLVKIGKLAEFRKVVIFGDRNEAGINFSISTGKLLSDQTSVSVARYRRTWVGNDPNTLTEDQVRYAVEHAIPYRAWMMESEH